MTPPTLIDSAILPAILAQETKIRDLTNTILSQAGDWDEEEIESLRDHLAAADFADELAGVHDCDLDYDRILHGRALQLKAWHLHQLDTWLTLILTPATGDES